jgi:hypothetical protein
MCIGFHVKYPLFLLDFNETWTSTRDFRYSEPLRVERPGDRIPVGGAIIRTLPDRPWSPPSPLCNGYLVFLGVGGGGNAAGPWLWPPTPIYSSKVKERENIYLYSLSGPEWSILGWILLYLCSNIKFNNISPLGDELFYAEESRDRQLWRS